MTRAAPSGRALPPARTTSGLPLVSLPRNDPRDSQQPLPLTRACDHVPGTLSHGALRARNRRSRSSHKEWCLKRSEQVEVMSVERLAVRGSVDSAAPTLGRGILG